MADDSALTEMVRRAAQANAKLYKGWMDLTLEYMRALSEIFGGAAVPSPSTPAPEMDAGTSTLVLEGEAGSAVTGSFLVSNDLDRPISCKLTCSDFAGPTGVVAKVRAAFAPPSLELAPGAQQVVKVTLDVDDSLAAGVGYAGEIAVAGMDGFAVPVVLRRQHSLDEDDAELARDLGSSDARRESTDATATGARAAASASKRGKAAPGAKRAAKAPVRKTERRR